jgi:hypothetical protein
MNDFMNSLWNATGSTVTGYDNGLPFIGKIASVRSKAGNDLSVMVELTEPCGNAAAGETLGFLGTELFNGHGGMSHNLHVYFE